MLDTSRKIKLDWIISFLNFHVDASVALQNTTRVDTTNHFYFSSYLLVYSMSTIYKYFMCIEWRDFFAEKGEKHNNKLFEMAGRIGWHENA